MATAVLRLLRPLSAPAFHSITTVLSFSFSGLLSSPVLSLSSLRASLSDVLFPAILWAVPKSKISHSRKRMRSSNKAIKNREDIVSCPCCGSSVLLHHACLNCYRHIRQGSQELHKPISAA